jgi:hypothetical protein
MIAKKLVDELVYSKEGNEVLLVKYLRPGAPEVSSGSNSRLADSEANHESA